MGCLSLQRVCVTCFPLLLLLLLMVGFPTFLEWVIWIGSGNNSRQQTKVNRKATLNMIWKFKNEMNEIEFIEPK